MGEKILSDILVFVGLMTVFGCVTGIIITFLKRGSRQLPARELTPRLDDIVERLTRLENSVDATALEVERISEGQRFTTKLLAERNGASTFADRPRGGSTTPH